MKTRIILIAISLLFMLTGFSQTMEVSKDTLLTIKNGTLNGDTLIETISYLNHSVSLERKTLTISNKKEVSRYIHSTGETTKRISNFSVSMNSGTLLNINGVEYNIDMIFESLYTQGMDFFLIINKSLIMKMESDESSMYYP